MIFEVKAYQVTSTSSSDIRSTSFYTPSTPNTSPVPNIYKR